MKAPGAPLKKSRDNQMIEILQEDTDDVNPRRNLNMLFEIMSKPLDDPLFVPTPNLEKLDSDLCKEEDEDEDEDEDEEDLSSNEEMIELKEKPSDIPNLIENYKKTLKISVSEAFELLRRCHYCGSAEMEFGDGYCGPRCQDYHIDFNYPCYWNRCDTNAANCKICIYLPCG